jgi:DNA-binding MarR family transcriptional regulator
MVTATEPHETDSALDSLMGAARVFAGITAGSLAQVGDMVTMPQLRVLVLASTRPGLNNRQVAEALGVHLSNASRTCDRLVQAGLLDRRESAEDRRRVQLSLTDSGHDLLDTVMAYRRTTFRRILQQLSPNEQAALTRALDTFRERAAEQIERRFAQL